MSNWIDNAIAFLSPRAGAQREAWRQSLEEMRSYDAGSRGRLYAGWGAVNQSAEATNRFDRDTVRARARDLERNSDLMTATLSAYRRNVIGYGYVLQSKNDNAKYNKDIEKLWNEWCKARNCDVTGAQSLNELLRMAVDRKRVDGGILIHKCYTSHGVVPFQLQMIEVDELDSMQLSPHSEGNHVVGGIELNKQNRPVGYWIRQYDDYGMATIDPVYLDAKDVIYYWEKKRPSQVREMSSMAPTISRIRDANEFMTAVSVKERIQACLSVFIKKQYPTSGLGRTQGVQGPDGQITYDGKMLTPGMIKEMNPGDEVQVINPTGQSADATSFTRMQQRLIAAGQGLSYEAVSRDVSETNYSSCRFGSVEDDLTYQEEIEKIKAILDEIYETFVISAYLCGKVKFSKSFWDHKEEYFAHEWIKPPKRWVDPVKESNANRNDLQTMAKSFKAMSAEQGHDWRQVIDDNAEVIRYAEEQGIDITPVLFGTSTTQQKEYDYETVPKETDEGGDDDGSQEEGS